MVKVTCLPWKLLYFSAKLRIWKNFKFGERLDGGNTQARSVIVKGGNRYTADPNKQLLTLIRLFLSTLPPTLTRQSPTTHT